MKAAMDTVEETTTFTYDVNNVPQEETIPVWSYAGEGNGTGGSIVMQALNNWHSTAQNNAYLTVIDNNMNIRVGSGLSVTTVNGGQDYNSKLGIKMTTDAAFDLAATGNIRVGSNGIISVVGVEGIILCTDATLSLNAGADIVETAAGAYYLDAVEAGIGTNVKVDGNLDITNQITAGTLIGNFPGLRSGPGANTGGPGGAPAPINPSQAQAALSAGEAQPAEVKPLNEKINILATWLDPDSKFRRNSQGVLTTVSKFPTYEPCPEHERFSFASIAGYTPVMTPDDETYEGSSGIANSSAPTPAAAVNPGAENTSVSGDPVSNSSVTIDVDTAALKKQLIRHEGRKNKIYLDTSNKPHGGIGHLLRTNEILSYPVGAPISDEQIETWYTDDSSSAIKIGQELMGNTWGELSDIRKRAVVDLSYNLGKAKLAKFHKFITAMKAQKFDLAGIELRNSKWFDQVGVRGPNVVSMVERNLDPTISRRG
jgi:lysozyme